MFVHEKQLFHPMEIKIVNLQHTVILQEQFGGDSKANPQAFIISAHKQNCHDFCLSNSHDSFNI